MPLLHPYPQAQSESGLLGLCLTYALPITGTLHAMLTSSAEAETDLVSVERVKQFVAQGAKEEDGETRRVLEVQVKMWGRDGGVDGGMDGWLVMRRVLDVQVRD